MKRKSGAMQIRSFDYQVKAIQEDGLFSGYGSVFGTVDSYNEVVAPGAFLDCIAEIKAKGRTLPVLWQHRSGEPIGDWDIDSLKEDDHGLFGTGQLWLQDAPYAKIAYRGMQSRSITGLSIGYYVRDSSYDEKTGILTLKRLDLVEISIVTTPANDDARIDAIKARIAHGNLPNLPDFEKLLREAGFSKTQATVIASRGLKHLLRSESEGESEHKAAVLQMNQLLSGFSLPPL
ncbi:HK97 family phage prohead protease [Collimonas humicola]|uniref:HK97 family phage prohead protease n=1 Tax=Collimonas humicola TaxID=2825886 RepID=UPI001B8C8CB3|nr:HK97 family phage prohead protease [Collimonas humicola]